MLQKVFRSGFISLWLLLLTGCQFNSATLKPATDTAVSTEYRLELVKVKKQLRSGTAVFKVFKRNKPISGSTMWHVATGETVEIAHVGKALDIVSPVELKSDTNGLVSFKILLKDPLKYFKWVKPDSYPIAAPYLYTISDAPVSIPFSTQSEWTGWENAQADTDYFVKLKLHNVLYWLPISHKDIRPVLRGLNQQVFQDKVSKLTLRLHTENDNVLQGVDIFLSGQAQSPAELLNEYITDPYALQYAASTFPEFLHGREGGYDATEFHVLPGSYQLEVIQGNKKHIETINVTKQIQQLKKVVVSFN